MNSNSLGISSFIFSIILLFSHCKKADDIPSQDISKPDIPSQIIPRDKAAHHLHYPTLQKTLHKKGIDIDQVEIFLSAFKYEEKLEVWIKEKTQKQFIFFKFYDFCKSSGQLGPKRKEGDYQIPEGLYHINVFNPLSHFHLSLGIDYPNYSDKILSDSIKPGSDIYIHGGCITIGCIPITDKNIKELYTLASIAQQNQEKISVHIFPFKMNKDNMQKWIIQYPKYAPFWKNLQIFYTHFEQSKILPLFSITKEGIYQ